MSPTAVTKPVLPPLQTPQSASFPSEICSTPISACLSAVIKQEHDLRTPITPPTAYTDFLKALTPILASPPPTALNRTLSDDSNVSKDSSASVPSTSTASSFSGRSTADFKSPSCSYPPPTPLSAPSQHRRASLKRLRIPQQHSPIFSPGTGPSPRTAMSGVTSALYSPFSPADWSNPSSRIFDTIATPRSACSKSVSVRSVVTRTVTYKRTTPNLDPAPKGKRRKTTSTTSSVCGSEFSEDEIKRMPPPPPLISIKESTPEEREAEEEDKHPQIKSEAEAILPAIIPATATEA
ncbi:hypothetical protein H2198_001454 [Neophaeococcomyces mojaviensis]|uniref:Uncharacterized protein n=1 Tax=Neophaeococcomyces mojaviensis TaxID=3383035 RepID=A0ACC3AH11_9EURO|nr:hypothetical protein H2198_001454 [Knufia sp. JES_112]